MGVRTDRVTEGDITTIGARNVLVGKIDKAVQRAVNPEVAVQLPKGIEIAIAKSFTWNRAPRKVKDVYVAKQLT